MKTSVGMDKAKVWLSGDLGTNMATRLFRGVALGALLVAATGLYFSINQGEAGSPLASEQMAVAEDAGIFEETVLPGRYGKTPVAAAGMRDPSSGRLLSSRELERLDYEADMMLLD